MPGYDENSLYGCRFDCLWVLALILGSLITNGYSSLSFEFFSGSPEQAGRAGGIFPILVSTLWVVGLSILFSAPIAILTAIYINEYARTDSFFSRSLVTSLNILASVPSIVFGLFGYAFFSIYLGLGFSILSGALTLSCMVLPILIVSLNIGLQSAPKQIRTASHALGISRFSQIRHFLLPMALPSLAAGLTLGIGRAIAETAALVFTSGYVDRMPTSVLDSGRTLSIHIYDLAMNVPGGIKWPTLPQ